MPELLPAVQEAITAADLGARDAAAAALLCRYAELLDEPAIPTKYRAALRELAIAARTVGTPDAADALATVIAALSEQTVASDLGPKLLAGLTALGLTLAGRGEKGKEPIGAPDPARAAHDEVKARRALRKHNATSLDAAAP